MESEKLNLFFSTLDRALEDDPSRFENLDADWLGHLQAQAGRTYQQLPVPNFKEKSWSKFSGLEINGKFSRIANPKITNSSLDEKGENLSARIIVCETDIRFEVGAQAAQQGLVVCSLEEAAEKHARLLASSLTLAEVGNEDKLAAFNAAASRHGFLLYVPRNVQLEKAVEILVQSERDNVVFPTSVWIILEQQAQASVILRQTSMNEDHKTAITSLVLALDLREDASLHLLEAQQYNRGVWTLSTKASRLASGASLDQFVLDLGSTVNKRVLTATLQGDGSQASITGIYTRRATRFISTTHIRTTTLHTPPATCCSTVCWTAAHMRCGRAMCTWRPAPRARMDSRSTATCCWMKQPTRNPFRDWRSSRDDVRCSHAVTLSSVDPEQMFFLESRGIGPAEAKELIVSGFLEAASNRMKDQTLQEIIREAVK